MENPWIARIRDLPEITVTLSIIRATQIRVIQDVEGLSPKIQVHTFDGCPFADREGFGDREIKTGKARPPNRIPAYVSEGANGILNKGGGVEVCGNFRCG